jgi:phage-related minor tail protein
MIDVQREEAEARREQAEALSELWDAWATGGDGALDLQGQIEHVGARIKDASDKLRGMTEAAVSNANRMAEAWGNTFGGALQTGLDAIVDFAITGQASFAQMTSAILADIAKIALRMMVLQALQGMGVGGAGGFAGAFVGALGGGLNLGSNATARRDRDGRL